MSLLEVMLALAVLAILLVSLVLVLTGGLRLISQADRSDQANALALHMMERIKERSVAPVEGHFDGRAIPTPQVLGFPPSPYPKAELERDFEFAVRVVAHSERLWHVKVEVYEDESRAATMEGFVLR